MSFLTSSCIHHQLHPVPVLVWFTFATPNSVQIIIYFNLILIIPIHSKTLTIINRQTVREVNFTPESFKLRFVYKPKQTLSV